MNLPIPSCRVLAIIVTITLGPSVANALTAVGPAPGLACMSLDSQALQAMQQSQLPTGIGRPNVSAPRIGYPTEFVLVQIAPRQVNGYTEMENVQRPNRLDFPRNHLTTWHPPTVKCQCVRRLCQMDISARRFIDPFARTWSACRLRDFGGIPMSQSFRVVISIVGLFFLANS